VLLTSESAKIRCGPIVVQQQMLNLTVGQSNEPLGHEPVALPFNFLPYQHPRFYSDLQSLTLSITVSSDLDAGMGERERRLNMERRRGCSCEEESQCNH